MKNTIKTLAFFLFLLGSIALQAQNSAVNTLFKQYAEDDKFTAVYISEHMFSLLGEIQVEGEEDQAIMDLLSGMKELHVLTTEEGDGMKIYEEASKKINTASYKNLMTVKDGDENVRIFIKESGKKNVIDELLLLVGSKEEFVLVNLIGSIDLDKISKLSGSLDIKGLDQLKQLEEKGE
jgi:hypothetical protein